MTKQGLFLFLLLMLLSVAYADISVSTLLSDHMVLQRDKPVPVWGTASPGECVTVNFGGQNLSTKADSQGDWRVDMAALSAESVGRTMTISGTNTITVTDVVVGDVWLFSGQSNMAFNLGGCDRREDISSADFPQIRSFTVPLATSGVPLKTVQSNWVVCSPSTASGFSAVAFYYARKVHQDQGIPIGIIVSSVGGTRIDPWLAPDGVVDIPTLHPLLNQSVLPWGPFSLFNGMIYPLAPYGIKGAIWYQGENAETTIQSEDSYYLKMKALHQGWKRVWGMNDFAYYFVNLANWGALPEDSTPVLNSGGWDADTRIQQTNAMSLPHAGMASALDIGETDDMHPKNKLDLGERLALWTFKNDFGQSSVVASGPILKDVTVSGSTVICSFDYVGTGLMIGNKVPYQPTQEIMDGTLERFVIAGSNGVWYPATAAIVEDTVHLSSPSVAAPAKVSYASWQNPLGCNLYNREGLPAACFHVEDINAKHTITAVAGAGGSVTPAGATTVLERQTKLYMITPEAGYYIEDVSVDGVSVGSVETFTFDPVYANHTIEAAFSTTAPHYTITASSGGGGTLSPSGIITVIQGQTVDFVAVPETGNLALLSIDGVDLNRRSTYSFVDVRNNHTITATYQCIMKASAGFGGSITPYGKSQVPYGSSITYEIVANEGYVVSEVFVDGVDVGRVARYTFSEIVQGHTIAAHFQTEPGVSRGYVPQPNQIIFSCRGNDLPETGQIGSWPAYMPTGQHLTIKGDPAAVTNDGKTYAVNSYEDYDGFQFSGSYTSPISSNGATIAAVVRPIRIGSTAAWSSIVDVFYNTLVMGVRNDTGQVCVIINDGGIDYSDFSIPDGQLTILTLVAQPNGNYQVWANGKEIMNVTKTSDLTTLRPGTRGFDTYITIGRNWPDGWTTFNGHIGDVFLYRNALNKTEREELERFVLYGALDSDLNRDGFVDFADFAQASFNWLDGFETDELERFASNWLAGSKPTSDETAPTPNPATFAKVPTALGTNSVTMTATTGEDISNPVEYYFAETTGNPGGDDSGWVLSPIYMDEGLTSGTEYTYNVAMRDAAGNVTAPSGDYTVTTSSGGGASGLIGINFGPASAVIAEEQFAGVIELGLDQNHWNNVLGSVSASVVNLVYDSASSSGMSCSWTGQANTFNTTGSGDAVLTGNFVQAAGSPAVFALSNIPYSNYHLVLYYNAFGTIYNDSRVDLDYASDGSIDRTVYISDKDDFVSYDGSEYVEFISDISSAGAPAGANFGIIHSLNASHLTVTVSGSSFHHSLAGIQIVDNPSQ